MEIRHAFMFKAMEKAAEVNPESTINNLTMKVQSSNGGYFYEVNVRKEGEHIYGTCECRAGIEQKACFHLGHVYSIFRELNKPKEVYHQVKESVADINRLLFGTI